MTLPAIDNSAREWVDEETGEIIEETLSQGPNVTTHDLPSLGRALSAIHRRIAMVESYRIQEFQRIGALCDQKVAKLRGNADRLTEICRGLADASGEKKLEYPGVGTFKWVKGRERINIDGYMDFDAEKRAQVQTSVPEAFRTVTTTAPDLRKVKELLEAGDFRLEGFEIERGEDKFTFKPE